MWKRFDHRPIIGAESKDGQSSKRLLDRVSLVKGLLEDSFHCLGSCDVTSQVRGQSIQIGIAHFRFAEKRHDRDAFAHEEPGERRGQIGSLVLTRRLD